MNISRKPDSEYQRRPELRVLPVIALVTLFVAASALLPSRARTARTAPAKRNAVISASAGAVATRAFSSESNRIAG